MGRRAGGGRVQAGIALLLVVWLLALLTVIAGEFMASGRVKAAAEHNKRDDLRGLALALAGYRAAVAALDDQDRRASSSTTDGRLLLHYSGRAEGVAAAADDVPLGDGTYSWRISDEDGLVNINKAQRPVLENLLQQCGMEPGAERDTVIDSILDWRDANRDHRLNGAEEDYYRGLDPPYSCKDGPFDVVEELLLVRGVTPRLFAGGEVGRARRSPGCATSSPPRPGRAQRVDGAAGGPGGLRPAAARAARPADRPLAALRDRRHRQTGRRRAAAVAARRRAAGRMRVTAVPSPWYIGTIHTSPSERGEGRTLKHSLGAIVVDGQLCLVCLRLGVGRAEVAGVFRAPLPPGADEEPAFLAGTVGVPDRQPHPGGGAGDARGAARRVHPAALRDPAGQGAEPSRAGRLRDGPAPARAARGFPLRLAGGRADRGRRVRRAPRRGAQGGHRAPGGTAAAGEPPPRLDPARDVRPCRPAAARLGREGATPCSSIWGTPASASISSAKGRPELSWIVPIDDPQWREPADVPPQPMRRKCDGAALQRQEAAQRLGSALAERLASPLFLESFPGGRSPRCTSAATAPTAAT